MIKTRTRSINGYMLKKSTDRGESFVEVIYLINGVYYTESKYFADISDEQEKKIKDKLDEYTGINKQAKNLYEIVPLTTITKMVEDIILNK